MQDEAAVARLDPRATHALIESVHDRVHKLAVDVAGSRRERVEELFQIGMEVVCDRARFHVGETRERFAQLIYHRVWGAMMDASRAEHAERELERALDRCIEPVTLELDVGDYFDPEEQRVAHRRGAAASIVAVTLLGLLGPREDMQPDLMLEIAEEQHRIRIALEQAATKLVPDDWGMVKDVFLEGMTYESAGASRNLTASGAWKRIGSSLVVLDREIRAQLG